MVYLFQGNEAWPLKSPKDTPTGFWYISGQFFYFSVTTMTTTGYGDLSPKSSFAMGMVIVQLLASAMFMQIIIALGVNMMTQTSTSDNNSNSGARFSPAALHTQSGKS